ncbi:MAG: hypothetical protein BRD46_05820 [Bacteroidetes bacterium QS_8_68_15]|nr:MAG: hypothetical protein BRD46_05820 [Bacteroidetes bacterium QS_8_68_15]
MSDRERLSFWQRVRHFVAGSSESDLSSPKTNGRPVRAKEKRNESKAASGSQDASEDTSEEGASFSALELRDRVVVMLLFDQVVSVEQVAAAWRHWIDDSTGTPGTLWRVVALLPEVDADTVHARAARVYAFEPVDFNMYSARALMRKYRGTFTEEQWTHMVRLNVAPVRTEYAQETDSKRWTFATHDPARPSVEHLLEHLTKHLRKQQGQAINHQLRYAPKTPIENVFDDALPARWLRARPEPPELPRAPSGKKARQKSRRFLRDVARGDASGGPSADVVEAVLQKAGGGDRAQTRGGDDPARAAGGRREEDEDAPAPSVLFDEVLTGVVQSSAQAVYLFGNARGALEIYHRRHRRFRHRRTEEHVSADTMIDFASGRILSLRPGKNQEGVERWVGDRRVEFRPSIVPAHELPEGVPADPDTEVVVIEIVQ